MSWSTIRGKVILISSIILVCLIAFVFKPSFCLNITCLKKCEDKIITNYFPIFIPVVAQDSKLYIAIRSYNIKSQHHFLVVDPYTLKTYQKMASTLKYRRPSNDSKNNGWFTAAEIEETPYYQALQAYSIPTYGVYFNPLQKHSAPTHEVYGYGVKHAYGNVNGVFLTIDMCPSYKPFEKEFYETLIHLANEQKKPLPVAISITSLWMLGHEQEFQWLATQPMLDITWVNHSFSHQYYRDMDMQDNFLNLPRTNPTQEILYIEQMLLSKGLTPSVFFRFPGLVSSPDLLKMINEYGLIPVSTDAWLAKGEKPTAGSIILVHGNSNEHEAIEIFMEWSKSNKLPFLPLQQAISSCNK